MTTTSYREPLPADCPPDEAERISTARDVYRLVRASPPTEADFLSQRAEKPNRPFWGVTECQARGLSVFAAARDAERQLKLPRLRGRRVCRVRLDAGAGSILQTGRPSHHTWWPLADFDILRRCAKA